MVRGGGNFGRLLLPLWRWRSSPGGLIRKREKRKLPASCTHGLPGFSSRTPHCEESQDAKGCTGILMSRRAARQLREL